MSEIPAILIVSENCIRAGPPKSESAGFEELNAANSRSRFLCCVRGIHEESIHYSGTADHLECVLLPRPQWTRELMVIAPEYLFTGSFLFHRQNADVAMPVLACRWHAGAYLHAGCQSIIQCHHVIWKLLM